MFPKKGSQKKFSCPLVKTYCRIEKLTDTDTVQSESHFEFPAKCNPNL